ncbi:interferon-stimulated 20 kDa exonuclease-like 2 isoform X2 [Synchiropus splendidus]|nr:interferon-stimulated 20 kDa exonuclease-like 2 isoform X2 [Synchiropus splendidus]
MSDITINVCPLDFRAAPTNNQRKMTLKQNKKAGFAEKDQGTKKRGSPDLCNVAMATSSSSSHLTVNSAAAPGEPREAPATNIPQRKRNIAATSAGTAPAAPTKYLALDCEMVGAGPKGSINQLARCSIVSYDGDVVYDKFIRPALPVTDYRTRWSGIRHRDLVRATPYAEARKEILRLLGGKVVVGHAIHNDLKVLSYGHPTALIRDTSRIPLLNRKAGFPEKECVSLKRLTKALLDRDIQVSRRGHSSVEDAKATMELYKMVEVEWERQLATKERQTERLLHCK